jgi:hypothetical protein
MLINSFHFQVQFFLHFLCKKEKLSPQFVFNFYKAAVQKREEERMGGEELESFFLPATDEIKVFNPRPKLLSFQCQVQSFTPI